MHPLRDRPPGLGSSGTTVREAGEGRVTEVEWVDIVDGADQVIGTAPRPLLRDGGLNYRVVHVLALDRHGHLLVQRLASGKSRTFAFGSSVAGHVRTGESYEMAAEREFEEELGCRPGTLVSAGKTWLDESTWRKFIGVFVTRTDGPFRLDPTEVAGIERMTLPEVRRRLREQPSMFSATFGRVFRHVDAQGAWPE